MTATNATPTVDEFPDAARDTARAILVAGMERMMEAVQDPSTKVDDVRKIVADMKDVARAVPEKKVDPLANLPVFSITFVNGAMQGLVEAPPAELVLLDLDETGNPVQLEPTPAMLAMGHLLQRDVSE